MPIPKLLKNLDSNISLSDASLTDTHQFVLFCNLTIVLELCSCYLKSGLLNHVIMFLTSNYYYQTSVATSFSNTK